MPLFLGPNLFLAPSQAAFYGFKESLGPPAVLPLSASGDAL